MSDKIERCPLGHSSRAGIFHQCTLPRGHAGQHCCVYGQRWGRKANPQSPPFVYVTKPHTREHFEVSAQVGRVDLPLGL